MNTEGWIVVIAHECDNLGQMGLEALSDRVGRVAGTHN